ncbi:MAG: hypothetical protein QNK05_12290 [Myxococcota bacterium]|nr:hypothetical protein [Myxococcota bacterium]
MIKRRDFVVGGVAAAALAGVPTLFVRQALAKDLPAKSLLDDSEFVYISPLKSDGAESTCHGEVWYGWLDESVVIVTSKDSWKARSLAKGLDTARVWVGNHGRWKGGLGTRNEAFRKAPSFDAKLERSQDESLLERLMVLYRTKYPGEIGKWEPRFRDGFASGERVMLRYRPA